MPPLSAVTAQSAAHDATAQPLAESFQAVRGQSLALTEGLTAEDMVVQSMEDASPTKWHLAHTTWFFEQFILDPHMPGYRAFDPDFAYLFNSYYVGAGPRHARPRRGMLTRPGIERVREYRAHVDAAMADLLHEVSSADREDVRELVVLGLNHEQQHQELLLTDLLHALSCNPLAPAYRSRPQVALATEVRPLDWIDVPGGLQRIGHDGDGFAFDHEGPRHDVLLRPCRLASRLVSNEEWLAFMADGGYRRPELWLSDGWSTAEREGWRAPLYWQERDGGWHAMTLHGLQPVEPAAPVAHISYYEADAFARWAGKRLPTEQEWEVAAQDRPVAGNTTGSAHLRPMPAQGDGLQQLFGDCWEWTQSAYAPYPGYKAPAGTVGEYNGKFMANQMVLRGASCVTPDGHSRPSYRNFFYPHQRWQFMGLRLAEDAT